MVQKAVLCCPEPAVKNHLHPHEIPNGSTGVPTTPGYACSNPLYVTYCGSSDPTPITLEGQDCDGAPVAVTGNSGELTAVVQAPGTVFKVQLCDSAKDYEKVILCDVTTGHKIAVITDFTDPTSPAVTYWDINASAAWTGSIDDLEACPDTDLESDPIEMCDGTSTFLRWIVKSNGEPTGEKFDTNLTGAPYTVVDEALATLGKCEAECVPTISSTFGDNLSVLLPGTTISVQKPTCCALKVMTSAGSFLIAAGVAAYSTSTFKCAVSVEAIEIVKGTCNIADVIITTQG